MKKLIFILILLSFTLASTAQDSLTHVNKSYEQFQQHFLSLDLNVTKIARLPKESQRLENTPVVVGAIAFIGIMTLSKISENSRMTNAAYFTTCGIIVSSATLYCIFNKEHKYKPKKRR
jgi:hypothetical protein